MDLQNIWLSWGDIHTNENQLKRLESAKGIACTPVNMDPKTYLGIFQGKKVRYETSLTECECFDFQQNTLPCKHIYRLALELGIIEGEYQSDLPKVIDQLNYEKALELIESTAEESQQIVRDFLYQHLYQIRENYGFLKSDYITELVEKEILIIVDDLVALFDAYGRNEINSLVAPFNVTGFKKNLKKDVLVEWIITNSPNIIPEITKDSISVTIHPQLTKAKRKIYSHLKQKFQEDISWLWE